MNRRILMTGAGSSFGALIADRLAMEGNSVYTVGNHINDRYFMDFDCVLGQTDANLVEGEVFNEAEKFNNGGFIDTLIYNAGVTHIDYVESHSLRDFQRVMNINLIMAYAFAAEFVKRVKKLTDPVKSPEMRSALDFRLIFTGSQAAKMGFRACPAYSASKAALHLMAQSMAREFAGRLPITVLVVAPSSVDSSGMKDYAVQSLVEKRGMTLEEAEAYNAKSSPMGYIPHEDVWKVFKFALNAPKTMSGEVLYMPAGMGM